MRMNGWKSFLIGLLFVGGLVGGLIATGRRPMPIVVVVVDASYSLAVPPTKLEALRRGIVELIEPMKGRWKAALVIGRHEQVGVHTPEASEPITSVVQALGEPGGGSVLWRAVEEGSRLVPPEKGAGAMIVISDGIPLGGGATAAEALQACVVRGVPVVVVRLGTEAPLPPLAELARRTGGVFVDLPEPSRFPSHVEFIHDAVTVRTRDDGALPHPTAATWLLWIGLAVPFVLVAGRGPKP